MFTTVRSGGMPSRFAGGLDDADVRLVRHEPVDVGGRRRRPGRACACAESTTARTARRKTSWPSIFRYCSPAAIVSGVAGMRLPPAGISSSPVGRAVAAEVPARAGPGRRRATRSSTTRGGAVAEEDARAAVVRVDDAARASRRRSTSTCSRLPAVSSDGAGDELVDEARAPGAEVERAAAQAEAVADERAGVGDRLLGRRGGDDRGGRCRRA